MGSNNSQIIAKNGSFRNGVDGEDVDDSVRYFLFYISFDFGTVNTAM
jgi:hypothetical protein